MPSHVGEHAGVRRASRSRRTRSRTARVVRDAAVVQRLVQALVGLGQVDVLADHRDRAPSRSGLLHARATTRSHALEVRAAPVQMLSTLRRSSRRAPRRGRSAAPRRWCSTSLAVITASSSTLQKSAIFAFTERGRKRSVRHRMMSGGMPTRAQLLHRVLHAAWSSARRRSRCRAPARCGCSRRSRGPTSARNWRIASRNGSDSMSPTVPPTSTISTSDALARPCGCAP